MALLGRHRCGRQRAHEEGPPEQVRGRREEDGTAGGAAQGRQVVLSRVETKVFVFVFSRKLSLFASKFDKKSRK
jgi:hypothetical protein